MKTRISTTIIALLFFSNISFSQDYYHAAGAQFDMQSYTFDYSSPGINSSTTSSLFVPGLFYKATLAFDDKLAVSAYPFLGLNFSLNSRSGGSGAFGVQLPVNAEMYFGDPDDECFFFGGGLTYSFIVDSEDFIGYGSVFGPQVAIGGQFYILDYFLGARLAYAYALNNKSVGEAVTVHKDRRSLLTLGVYYPLF